MKDEDLQARIAQIRAMMAGQEEAVEAKAEVMPSQASQDRQERRTGPGGREMTNFGPSAGQKKKGPKKSELLVHY